MEQVVCNGGGSSKVALLKLSAAARGGGGHPPAADHSRHHLFNSEVSRRSSIGTDTTSQPKIVTGEAGYILEDVPHLSDYIPDLPTYPNPLQDNPAYSVVKQYFVDADDTVPQKILSTELVR